MKKIVFTALLFMLGTLLPISAEASIAVPQSLGHQTCQTCVNSSASFSSLPHAGSTIVVTISYLDYGGAGGGTYIAPTDITDNQGHSSYTLAAATSTGAAFSTAYVYYISNISAPSGTYTVTINNNHGGSGYLEWTASEVTGLAASPLDQATSTADTGAGGLTSGSVGPTGVTKQASEISFAVLALQNTTANNAISTPGSGYNELYVQNDTNANQGGEAGYKILTSTGAQTASWTWSVGDFDFSGMIATFKGSSTIVKPSNNFGLVGYWPMNEGTSTRVSDFSGNPGTSTAGTLTNGGSGLPIWTNGKFGKALQFNGSNNYVTAGNIIAMNGLTQITVSAWIKASSNQVNTGDAFIALKSNCTSAPGDGPFQLDVSSGDTPHGVLFNLYTAGGLFGADDNGISNVDDGRWHQVVGEYDGNIVTTWVDGIQTKTNTVGPNTLSNTTNKFEIGGDCNIGRGSYNGTIDDVRVYNRAISPSEITKLYKNGASRINTSSQTLTNGSTLTSGLVGHWTFDGKDTHWTSSSAGTTNDLSGNGNTGTLTNMNQRTSVTPGKLGQALKFDGSQSYVSLPNNTSLHTDTATLSMWVKTTADTGVDNNIFQAADGATTEFSVEDGNICTGSGNNPLICIFVLVSGSPSEVLEYDTASRQQLFDGKWHHVVITVGAATTLYIDDVSKPLTVYIGGDAHTFTGSGAYTLFSIGAAKWNGSWINFFPGSIDDVRIYNRALSAAEVKQLYNIGAGVMIHR